MIELRPVHTKNDNYNDIYISVRYSKQVLHFFVCHFKCSSSLKHGEFWLDVNVFIVYQLEKILKKCL